MEKTKSKPTVKRRKNLLTSKVLDIPYQDLYLLYENKFRLKNLSDTTIRGYFFADKYFMKFAGNNLKCSEVTQDILTKLFALEIMLPSTLMPKIIM